MKNMQQNDLYLEKLFDFYIANLEREISSLSNSEYLKLKSAFSSLKLYLEPVRPKKSYPQNKTCKSNKNNIK